MKFPQSFLQSLCHDKGECLPVGSSLNDLEKGISRKRCRILVPGSIKNSPEVVYKFPVHTVVTADQCFRKQNKPNPALLRLINISLK